jgi:uncharacterized protein
MCSAAGWLFSAIVLLRQPLSKVCKFEGMNLAELYSEEVKALCRQYKVKRLSAFGSLVRGGFRDDSDIDLIVDFEPLSLSEYGRNYFNLKFALEDHFHRTVDLLEEQEIKNPYFKKNIDAYRQIIYAG